MRTIILATTVVMALVMYGPRANAYPYGYPWCAWLSAGVNAAPCAYTSLKQCLATVWGVGGYCYLNPYLPPREAARWRGGRRYR